MENKDDKTRILENDELKMVTGGVGEPTCEIEHGEVEPTVEVICVRGGVEQSREEDTGTDLRSLYPRKSL